MNPRSDFSFNVRADHRINTTDTPREIIMFDNLNIENDATNLIKNVLFSALKAAAANKTLLIIGFLTIGLIGSASVNVIFLQEGKHPAPIFGAQQQKKTTIAHSDTSRLAEIIISESNGEDLPNPLVREIQAHLAARGYYASKISGIEDARTRAAIGLYQRANNEPVTNRPSEHLLNHIRLSRPDPAYHTAARRRISDETKSKLFKATPETVLDRDKIKRIQSALAKLGYHQVTADGVVGPITRRAVINYKKKQGLPADGTLTIALYKRLMDQIDRQKASGGV